MVNAPKRPHSPEPMNRVHFRAKVFPSEDWGWGVTTNIMLLQTLFSRGLQPELSPDQAQAFHSPNSPVLPTSQTLGPGPEYQSQPCPSPRPGAAAGGSEEKRKDNEGFPFRCFQLLILPAQMPARELNCQQQTFGWNFGAH